MDRRDFLKTLGGLVVSAFVPALPSPPPLPAYLRAFERMLVSMDPRVRAALDGMTITTVQWEEAGGRRISFRTTGIIRKGVNDDRRLSGSPEDSGTPGRALGRGPRG